MHHEIIRATPSWQGGPLRYDCIYVAKGGTDTEGFCSLMVGRVHLFFSCVHAGEDYSCALVDWFIPVDDEPDEVTGMWIVAPEMDNNGHCVQSVVSLDSMVRGAHLMEFMAVSLFLSISTSLSLSMSFSLTMLISTLITMQIHLYFSYNLSLSGSVVV